MAEPMDFHKDLPKSLYQQATQAPVYRFSTCEPQRNDEIAITNKWCLSLDDSCGKLARLAGGDLARCLKETFRIKLKSDKSLNAPQIKVSVSHAVENSEAYTREVCQDYIKITAETDEGGMRALFHLQRELLNRRGPFLKIGVESRCPKWSLRITSPLLHKPFDDPADYLLYPESYLMNMARYGYNATYMYLNLFDYISPKTNPHLASTGWRTRLNALKKATEYLDKFGIRLFFHLNTLGLPANHKIFQNSPRMIGAQTFEEGAYCLCSSSQEVLIFYEVAAKQLFTDVPNLAGMVIIVGGECFLHCYTRPVPKTNSSTNCPRCCKRSPEDVISGAVNKFVRGINSANSNARILLWPYSGFSWGDLDTQARMLSKCDPKAHGLVTFEKDSWISVEGKKSYIFDYSIRQLGPSPRFTFLNKAARSENRAMLAKTETSQSIEILTVPRIPIMNRWAERYNRIRKAEVGGVHTTWRFYGFCGQRTDELVDYFAWAEKPDVEKCLAEIANRDFGPRAENLVLSAWKNFSEAFGHFPYSGGMTGLPYFRGPFYIGPAHPFIFDPNTLQNLPDCFYRVDPTQHELTDDPDRLDRHGRPTYFVDLSWTQPFGPARVKQSLGMLRSGWDKGLTVLTKALGVARGEEKTRLRNELDVAGCVGCIISTADNLLHFQMLRDKIITLGCNPASLKRDLAKIQKILTLEIDNATKALKLVQKNPALGFGCTYGIGFDADMIQAKIDDTIKQRDVIIPILHKSWVFHLFGKLL